MTFRLCNAHATFQRLMIFILSGLQWWSCLVHLDDIIIMRRTFPEHLHDLKNIFTRLDSSCSHQNVLFARKVSFLDHIISANGVATDPSKLEKVQNWPTPTP